MDGHHTYRMDKLVRDGAVATMSGGGATVEWRRLDQGAMKAELLAKLKEEAVEAASASTTDELVEELADVMEIIRALLPLAGTTAEAVEAARLAKAAKRGDFSERYYVDVIHCPVGSFWDAYCARDAEKYPRVQNGVAKPVND